MPQNAHVSTSDIRGYSRLAIDATVKLTGLVEAMHRNIARTPWIFGTPAQGPATGITGFVYKSICSVTGAVGAGLDQLLAQLSPLLDEPAHGKNSSMGREAFVAALNGVLGDHLAASGNPLALPMSLRRGGQNLRLQKQALDAALPQASNKLLVLVHGLCMNDLQFSRHGHDHGAALARDLGYTPVYLHYNSGRHISTNGREFSELLETLIQQWPVPAKELTVVAHSLGGLVMRSAFHYGTAAGHSWVRPLRKIVFLGTPHHGAPLERGGNWLQTMAGITPYTAPLARLGMIRSAGVTDLRHGNLLDEDWQGRDRFEHNEDLRQPVPLPQGVRCYAMAATTGKRRGDLNDRLLGDGLVPMSSALGLNRDPGRNLLFPESQRWCGYGMTHWDLLSRPEVYEQIRSWLSQ